MNNPPQQIANILDQIAEVKSDIIHCMTTESCAERMRNLEDHVAQLLSEFRTEVKSELAELRRIVEQK